MMKPEETKAGRWIEHNESKARRFIAGVKLNGDIIIELKSGGTSTLAVDWFKDWTVLPPECDSFDWQPETFPQYWTWQPETFPQYWTTLDSSASNTAFVKRYDSVRWHTVRRDGSESIDLGLSSDWNPDGRKQITEAEALALLDQFEQAESPDDWVTQDRVPVRIGTDEFAWFWHDKQTLGPWRIASGALDWDNHRHGQSGINATLHLRCRRKDLPPVPEPVNPATRKVVLTEWYCWDTDGTGISAINWSEHKPRGWDKCHTIGTREIEVPL